MVAQELTIKQRDGTFMRDPVFMAMKLRRTRYGDTITPIVHRGVPRPYDLLRCIDPSLQQERNREQGKARVTLRFDLSTLVSPVRAQPVGGHAIAFPDGYPSSKPAGTYQLHLAVVADGVAPVKKVVEITWSGTWRDHAAGYQQGPPESHRKAARARTPVRQAPAATQGPIRPLWAARRAGG